VVIETTTPTVCVSGPALRDYSSTQKYNAAVVEAQQLFNGVLDLRVDPRTAGVTGRDGDDSIGVASFVSVDRYLTVAYEANARRTYALSTHGGPVGITLKQFCSGHKSDFRRYLNPGQNIRDEYNALFGGFELVDVDLDTKAYRAAEDIIHRADEHSLSGLSYPMSEHLRDVRGVAVFTLDCAPEGLVTAVHEERPYLGTKDVPTLIRIPSGDIVILPGRL